MARRDVVEAAAGPAAAAAIVTCADEEDDTVAAAVAAAAEDEEEVGAARDLAFCAFELCLGMVLALLNCGPASRCVSRCFFR